MPINDVEIEIGKIEDAIVMAMRNAADRALIGNIRLFDLPLSEIHTAPVIALREAQ